MNDAFSPSFVSKLAYQNAPFLPPSLLDEVFSLLVNSYGEDHIEAFMLFGSYAAGV